MASRSPFVSFVAVLSICSLCFGVTGYTNSQDAATFGVLKSEWKNTPPNWTGSDPCGSQWDGVECTDSRVTSLMLSTMDIEGNLPTDIGNLIGLQILDLSYNRGLAGPIPGSLGNLINLKNLTMIACALTGGIPSELGKLRNLQTLALNSNYLSGPIPPSLGNLAQLIWFDIADNQLTDHLPISNEGQSGLDRLLNAEHFHLGNNNLSGPIPANLFSSGMNLIHLLFDSNNFDGEIPPTLGLVQSLVIVRLDRNSLRGTVPSSISNITDIEELNLSNNDLEGPLPDLSNMTNLRKLDLSNNSFDPSEAPQWFTDLQLLITLKMESARLMGELSSKVFDLPDLETVYLRNNSFSGSLQIDSGVASHLRLIDLRSNQISDADPPPKGLNLWLTENPVCTSGLAVANIKACQPVTEDPTYKTISADCGGGNSCSGELEPNPKTCQCQKPYRGQLVFRAPSFSDLTDGSRFESLESSLVSGLRSVSAVSLCCLYFDNNDYLVMDVSMFPPKDSKYFGRWDIMTNGYTLANQLYKPPEDFGPYIFVAQGYFIGTSKSRSLSSKAIIGIAVGASVLGLAIIGIGIYALRQKRRADKAAGLSRPFASSGANGQDNEGAPKLKGARWFSLAEIKKATDSFSKANEIGAGGYGQVYRGHLLGGEHETLAIKRAQQGSLQGTTQFKNEIELLSRVHHKNLVGLIGFCFEQGEQMLVYEYISNGTLRENLSGKMGIRLDWRKRIHIALGSASGLTYLHELANPPIIHRDVKSSNILLDENLTAKVADFGLSKLAADGGSVAGGKTHVSTEVKGTLGYLDPEYYMTHQLSDKSDVYSFGVVLLELVTARQPIERGKYIVREVRAALEMGGISAFREQLMDPFLRDSSTVLTGLENFVNLALRCVEEVTSHRPSMREVSKELESIADMGSTGLGNTRSSSSVLESAKENRSNHDPYADKVISENDESWFDYSGAYMVPSVVEPK